MRTSFGRVLATAALAALALGACGSSSKSSSSSATTAPATTPPATTPPTTAPSAAKAPTVSLAANSTIGKKVLVDSGGMTLYLYEKDPSGKVTCTGACAKAWPPYYVTGTATYGIGLDASKFSTITGSDGDKQLAIDGHALYRWVNDKKAGDATGQDVNTFYVVGADGKKIEK